MKVDIIRKFKWYIVGFILVAIMMSVSLSFCSWDSLSLQAKMSASKSGSYKEHIKLVDDIYLSNSDKGVNGIADVGDIVTLGNYYQNLTADGKVADKTAIRWIVVEKVNNQLTLLAEKVMAFGSFWGTYCYMSSGGTYNSAEWGVSSSAYQTYYQNYSQSTVRAWINSNYTLRNDGGTAFTADHRKQQFRGFLTEAFTANEQSYIVSKTISGMKGAGKTNKPTQENYATVTDKVWLPSYTEVYGKTGISWTATTADSTADKQFSYFAVAVNSKVGSTTAYASTIASNYTMDKAMGTDSCQNTSVNSPVWWWLRSPAPQSESQSLVVQSTGVNYYSFTGHSLGGIRPAVCVKL